MVVSQKREEKEQTSLGRALVGAGVQTTSQKLERLALEAWAHRPGESGAAARRKWMRDALQGELTYTLMEEWKPHMLAGAIGWALGRAEEKIREQEAIALAEASKPHKGKGKTSSGQVVPWVPPAEAHRATAAQAKETRREERRAEVLVKAAVKLSKLDTFIINGSPIGDLTPEEAIGWAASRERDARFVRMLTQGLPPDRPIRDSWRPDEADDIYQIAEDPSEPELLPPMKGRRPELITNRR